MNKINPKIVVMFFVICCASQSPAQNSELLNDKNQIIPRIDYKNDMNLFCEYLELTEQTK